MKKSEWYFGHTTSEISPFDLLSYQLIFYIKKTKLLFSTKATIGTEIKINCTNILFIIHGFNNRHYHIVTSTWRKTMSVPNYTHHRSERLN